MHYLRGDWIISIAVGSKCEKGTYTPQYTAGICVGSPSKNDMFTDLNIIDWVGLIIEVGQYIGRPIFDLFSILAFGQYFLHWGGFKCSNCLGPSYLSKLLLPYEYSRAFTPPAGVISVLAVGGRVWSCVCLCGVRGDCFNLQNTFSCNFCSY